MRWILTAIVMVAALVLCAPEAEAHGARFVRLRNGQVVRVVDNDFRGGRLGFRSQRFNSFGVNRFNSFGGGFGGSTVIRERIGPFGIFGSRTIIQNGF